MTFTLRCERCGVPHYRHVNANKTGGTGRLLRWQQDRCPICVDKYGPPITTESGGQQALTQYD